MSATLTRSPQHVEGPDGTIRVYVPGDADQESRREARIMAQRVHGNVAVGPTPQPVKAKRGHVYTFTPTAVRHTDEGVTYVITSPAVPAKAPKAPKVGKAPKAPKADPNAALIAQLTAQLAALTGGTVPAAAAPERKENPFTKRAREAKCKRCNDLGWTKGAVYLSKAGHPYKTPNGLAQAQAHKDGRAVKCDHSKPLGTL